MRRLLLAVAVLTMCHEGYAATVFKCVDAKGKVTFTAQANCPDDHALADVVSASNATISSDGERTLMAAPRRRLATRQLITVRNGQVIALEPPVSHNQVTVVGGSRELPPCDTGLNDQDLRTARVRGHLVPGMTRSQVASVQGDDSRIARGGAGTDTKWSHDWKSATSVSYDRNGCARRINTWNHR